METKDYKVLTDGRYVAGIRSPGKGKTISLTDLQAEHPLRTGDVELIGDKAKASDPKAEVSPSKPDAPAA